MHVSKKPIDACMMSPLTDVINYSFYITKATNKYNVGHKKRATLFWTVTSAFLDGFQHFVYQLKRNKCSTLRFSF